MGQKVNPHGFRVGVIDDWDSKWFADKDYQKYLLEDIKIREFIKDKQFQAGISRVAIERTEQKMRISIYTAKPGIVIGRQGSNIELLKKDLAKLTDSKLDINIIEVKSPDMDATLVAENVAGQLERRLARALHEFEQRQPQAVRRLSFGQAQRLRRPNVVWYTVRVFRHCMVHHVTAPRSQSVSAANQTMGH